MAPKPMLPVIPLGVNCDQFDPADKDGRRARWRADLGVGPDDLVVLYVGRLAFHAKAHPFPMYRPLELASRRVQSRIHLVQSGWFNNQSIEAAFREGAEKVAPGVTHHFLDGRGPEVRFGIWHAADVFCSLSDNIQETFGLTPLEAMAAGLPVVASDWDGYRETVEHGVQGFLVPTHAPAPGPLEQAARGHAAGSINYDRYLLHASSAVAVDVQATAEAFASLFANPGLRQAMGEAGRRRARALYDWQVIIRRYAELWAEMAEVRRTAGESSPRDPRRPADPLRDDPFALFAGYPTHRLGQDSRIVRVAQDLRGEIAALRALVMNGTAPLPGGAALDALCDRLEVPTPPTLSEVLADLPPGGHDRVARAVLWLTKMSLVEIHPPAGRSGRAPD